MTTAKYDIIIQQGADFALSMTLTGDTGPVDLTGYTGYSQMRVKKTSSAIAATFTIYIDTPLTGDINMAMANSVTELLAPGRYVYDLQIHKPSDSKVLRLLEGFVSVSGEVTRI